MNEFVEDSNHSLNRMQQGGTLAGKPRELIDKALALDRKYRETGYQAPTNPVARVDDFAKCASSRSTNARTRAEVWCRCG